MSTRAIAGTGELIANTDSYVSSALSTDVEAFLPAVNDGSGATVAVDKEIRVETTGSGAVVLLTNERHVVGVVPAFSQAVVVAQVGVQQGLKERWAYESQSRSPVAFVADAPAGGTGAAAGAWDTAGHRDSAIALLNAIKAALIAHGLMKSE